ncbi:helix-turn-helix domain-containing protein [Mesosutterella sp. OilRF-GAM-744-9]|uniref:Helix-turn-helix domain-containing protein n=1 Tax=Mesosutterella porci TaxID=2915351 RepID=A0ABS9MU72_9BURK|nr:MerR family transcriptional regulator [Mesosutterella sp. oilRF-744-WT-GAM-9]MCG5031568.1 helix-turn-helix domain-containing protein [Mesosutterella sp. oilRF-744-WT-GAM-9]
MQRKFSLDELSQLTLIPKRTIRFYIQLELVSRPCGEKRGAWYTARHLEELLQIQRLASRGLSLEKIKIRLNSEKDRTTPAADPAPGTVSLVSKVAVGRGLSILFDPKLCELSGGDFRKFIRAVLEAYESALAGSPTQAGGKSGTPGAEETGRSGAGEAPRATNELTKSLETREPGLAASRKESGSS